MEGYEAIVSPEAQAYLGVNPACIALLKDNTRMLVWNASGVIGEQYHTIRWFSDIEKKHIEEQIAEGDIKAIQDFLNRYI